MSENKTKDRHSVVIRVYPSKRAFAALEVHAAANVSSPSVTPREHGAALLCGLLDGWAASYQDEVLKATEARLARQITSKEVLLERLKEFEEPIGFLEGTGSQPPGLGVLTVIDPPDSDGDKRQSGQGEDS